MIKFESTEYKSKGKFIKAQLKIWTNSEKEFKMILDFLDQHDETK